MSQTVIVDGQMPYAVVNGQMPYTVVERHDGQDSRFRPFKQFRRGSHKRVE